MDSRYEILDQYGRIEGIEDTLASAKQAIRSLPRGTYRIYDRQTKKVVWSQEKK